MRMLLVIGVLPLLIPLHVCQQEETPKIITYPERGVLLTRTGTLVAINDFKILTAIVQLEPLTLGDAAKELVCYDELLPVKNSFSNKVGELKDTVNAVFTAQRILSTAEIIRLVNETTYPNQGLGRSKRFIAAGPYAMAGAGIVTAFVSLGISSANRIEINKLNSYITEHEEDITLMQQQLSQQMATTDLIMDTHKEILGIVRQLSINVSTIQQQIKCLNKYIQFVPWKESLLNELQNVLQYPLQGLRAGRPLSFNPPL